MRADEEREYVGYVTARAASLQRTAYVLCGDEHRAADLVQTAFTTLYVRRRRIRRMENIDAYVRKMVFRALLNANAVTLVDDPDDVRNGVPDPVR